MINENAQESKEKIFEKESVLDNQEAAHKRYLKKIARDMRINCGLPIAYISQFTRLTFKEVMEAIEEEN